jgi:hypothetical protein
VKPVTVAVQRQERLLRFGAGHHLMVDRLGRAGDREAGPSAQARGERLVSDDFSPTM